MTVPNTRDPLDPMGFYRSVWFWVPIALIALFAAAAYEGEQREITKRACLTQGLTFDAEGNCRR